MTNDNQDALGLAESCMECHEPHMPEYRMAAHLRRLVRENEEKESALKIVEATCDDFADQIEAKDALLRQAVQVAESQCEYELVAAIRQHLEGRA